jgi:hypothetical protein
MRRATTISRDEPSKIPYIDAANLVARTISTLTFWENQKWHMWIPTSDNLLRMKGRPIEADYFGRERERAGGTFWFRISDYYDWHHYLKSAYDVPSAQWTDAASASGAGHPNP